jgi:asparagine synthase (glutamine-hydrolysing)
MCGISGILNFHNRPIDKSSILKLNGAISHRGLDNSEILIGHTNKNFSNYKGIAIGHRRLSIIDLSNNGNQPMFNNSGNLCIVYNGEIYNAEELRNRFKSMGYTFKSLCDTEVLLAGYFLIGEKILEIINGMYSFSIWNEEDKSLFCARDPFGIKPFYYFYDKDSFKFSSESRALSLITHNSIDNDAYRSYVLMNYVPGTKSIFNGIKKLEKGTFIKVNKQGRIFKKKFWRLEDKIIKNTISFKESSNIIEEKLKSSVKRQLTSDVPVGVFLSGGFDSGLITALSSKYVENLHTYTVGFDDKIQTSEIHIASKLSKKYSTIHHEKIIQSKSLMNLLNSAVLSLNEPVADSAIVPSYFLSKCASEDGVKVVLSGTGGDEIFGGYEKYVNYSTKRSLFERTPQFIKNLLSNVPGLDPVFEKRLSSNSLDMILCTGGSSNILSQLFDSTKDFKMFLQKFENDIIPKMNFKLPKLNTKMKFDMDLYLPDSLLMFLDQVTMANTIEGRVPFLDEDLLVSCFNVNHKYHCNQNITRILQKKISENKLIKDTFFHKKQGFSGPVKDWVTKNIDQFKSVIFEHNSHGFNSKFLNNLFSKKVLDPNDYHNIFSMYVYSNWHKNNVL